MDADILKELVSQLTGTQEMLVVMDSGGAVSEMHARGMKPPEFEHGWAKVESRDWHVHLNMKTVDGVQFVEAEEPWTRGHSEAVLCSVVGR